MQQRIWIILTILFTSLKITYGSQSCSYIDYRGKNESQTISEQNCPDHQVCGRTLDISYIDIPPYSTGQRFESVVQACCGKQCTKLELKYYYKNISEVDLSEKSSDFILPFLGPSSADNLYGYYFIPFTNVPHAYYITRAHSSPIMQLVSNCWHMYALIGLFLVATGVSGCVVWVFETLFCCGVEQGSDRSPFLRDVFERFWWCFTIVTSGYGARIVQSLPAKLYSVIWILVGVLMFSLMTSTFTAELMRVMGGHGDSMTGANVGVLKYRDYDASLIVRDGGIVHETNATNFHADALTLIRMLRKNEIDGMLLDKYTLAYVKGYLEWKKTNVDFHINGGSTEGEAYDQRKGDIEFFVTNTETTLKEYDGKKLSYGVLVKSHADFFYLNDAVRDNRLSAETAVESDMNELFPRKSKSFTIHYSHYPVVAWIGAVIGCLSVFGVVVEFCHWYNHRGMMYTCTATD